MITAFQTLAQDDFPNKVSSSLKEAGYRTEENRYALEAYWPGLEWVVAGIGTVLGGCRLTRLSGGGGSWVSVVPHWGIPGVELTPTDRARVDRVVTTSREFAASDRLDECFRLIQATSYPALPGSAPVSVAAAGRVILGNGSKPLGSIPFPALKGKSLRPAVRTHLLYTGQTHAKGRLDPFAQKISSALNSLGVHIAIRHLEFGNFLDSLSRMTPEKVQDQSVVLIGVPGSKTDPQPIPEETTRAFQLMDRLHIPYRIFGEPSLDGPYAANDMAPYLAMLMGASLREVELAPAFAGTLFLGLDLGHPLHLGNSVPVLSVVDSRGRLLAWWRGQQIRDETLRRETITRATTWLLDWLRATSRQASDFVILRDGKLNKNDGLEQLSRALPSPSTLVEVVKNPVPLMRQNGALAKPGTWVEVVPGRDGFLQMPEPAVQGHIANPLRLRKTAQDDLHSLEDIAAAVFALCHAPTLGLRIPGAPAPIYWSDGLSANSGMDLQFRGLNHVPHHDEILEVERPPSGSATPAQK
jgi:hypothetical protein